MTLRNHRLVSIVIPCYNQARYLDECVQSVVAQTWDQWEAIIVDDASTDEGPGHILARIDDDRLRLIRHPTRRGPSSARNTAIRASRGAFLLPLDADDYLDPAFLASTVPILQRGPEVNCVYTDFELFGDRNGIYLNSVMSGPDMLRIQWIPGPGALMRKELWEEIGGYGEAFPYNWSEDWDFWISAVEHGVKPVHLSIALYKYRQHAESSMATIISRFDYLNRDVIYHRHAQLFDEHGEGNRFRAEGYLHTAQAAFVSGDRRLTLWAACSGLLLSPRDHKLAKLAILALAPPSIVKVYGNLRRPRGSRRARQQ